MLSLLLNFIPGVGPFLAFLGHNWKIVLGALAAVCFGLFVWSWAERGVKIAEQKQAIATLEANLIVAEKKTKIIQAGEAIVTLHLQDSGIAAVEVTKLIEGAKHAPPTADAPIAPVLRDALDGISRLRTPRP